MKVLHIVESLNRGAVENWLVRMLAQASSKKIVPEWTFYCTLGQPGLLDEKARTLGAQVVHSPVLIGKKAAFIGALRAELRRGRYDVMHCHHDLISAVYLLAAFGVPLGKRIVHVHNADEAVLTPSRIKQFLFREPMRRICLATADHVIGNSKHTLDTFLAGRRRRRGRDLVHIYGVDPTPFKNVMADRSGFRCQLGLRDDSLILLFAGRMVPEKNPSFVLDVLAELRRLESRAVAVFAGAGSQEQAVFDRAREQGLEHKVRLLGWRTDIPEIMCCCDWFILPHPEQPLEGFGLAVVEAQLAGLRMLLSQGISDDPLLPTASFRRLALSAGPKAWAEASIELLRDSVPSRLAALGALRESPMNMDRALEDLVRLYA